MPLFGTADTITPGLARAAHTDHSVAPSHGPVSFAFPLQSSLMAKALIDEAISEILIHPRKGFHAFHCRSYRS